MIIKIGQASGERAGRTLVRVCTADKLAHLHALSAAAVDDGRAEAFEAIVRDAIKRNDSKAFDEEFADGDPVERHGWRYLAAEMAWLLPPEQRQRLGFRPNDFNWGKKLIQMLADAGLTAQAEAHIAKLGGWRTDTAQHAHSAGVVFNRLFSRYDESEMAFRKAIELDPQYVHAWNGLGNALNGQRRYEEAEAACRQATELDPQYVHAWNGLGNALNGQRRYEEAEAVAAKPSNLIRSMFMP